MKTKRILAWFLCAVMMLTLMPAVVFAETTEIVQIEKSNGILSDKYASLSAAVAAAVSGDTLRLLENDTTKQKVTIDKSLTIELDGHSLTDTSLKVSGSDVTVSINDSVGGAKINQNHYTGFKWEGDISVLTRCSSTVFVTGGSTLKINGVTGTDENSGTIIYDCAADDEYTLVKAVFVDESTLEINGGTFVAVADSGRNSLFVYNGNVTVNDGYFYQAVSLYTVPSAQYPFVVKKCTINGGVWVEERGNFLAIDDIKAIFTLAQGSSVTDDSDDEFIKIKDESELATETWLNTAGNNLYVGGVQVTAANSENIAGDGITSGTAYFKVEDSIPTLYLNGVTIKDGYKIEDYCYINKELGTDYMYKIYGIYYVPASEDKLKIKFSGENVIKAEQVTDEKHKAAWIYGIIAKDNCKVLMFEGNENASIKIPSIKDAISANSGGVSINGGTYTITTDYGEDNISGYGIYADGTVEIDNAALNITARRNVGIEMHSYESNDKTIIRNSNVTVVGDTTGNGIQGVQSFGDLFIENSIVDVKGDGVGIDMSYGKSITISGENTVVSVKSIGEADDWILNDAAILTSAKIDYDTHESTMPDFTLNDGLAVTTPDAGRIDVVNNDYKTVVKTYNSYAREVVIKTPIEHCICGKENCTVHTGTIKHVADNSLNLVSGIKDGATVTSGNYYLSDDLEISDEKQLPVSGTVNICLNGHKLEANIIPAENAVLNICDCESSGTAGQITNSSGHVIAFRNNGSTVNIYGGTFETTYNTNTIIDFEGYSGNTLNLYGGTVKYEAADTNTAIGSRTLTVNLYGGKVVTGKSNGIVVLNGKVNLLGNTKISVPSDYNSIKVYKKELIDAAGYTGGNISILCDGLSDGDIVVKNVIDETADKFTLSGSDSSHVLKRAGNDLVYSAIYTVSFDANGGSGTMASVPVISGEYELPECNFTAPAEKRFTAWNVGGTEYAAGDTVNISKDTTILAVWGDIEKNTVTVDETAQEFGYDGNIKNFTVSANVTDGFTVKYQKDGSDIDSPTDAGTYDVIITRDADSTYYSYSKTIPNGIKINPKDISGAVCGGFEPMTYDGTVQTPQATVTIDGFTVTGVWSDVTNVADKTTFTANGNFTGTIEQQTTGMAKAEAGISTAPTIKFGLKYDKTEQVLIVGGEANGGVLKYSIDNKATWSEELPKGINAGQYEVHFKVFGDDNHTDSYGNLLRVSIEKANVAVPSVASKVYTGNLQTADISDNDYYTVSENGGGIQSGIYDVKITLKDNNNCYWDEKAEDVSEIVLDFYITKAENEWTTEPSIADRTYGETPNVPSYAAKFGEVTVEYKKADEEDSAYTSTVPVNVGNYKVRFRVAATDDFGGLSKVIDLTVAKAQRLAPETPTVVKETVDGKLVGKIIGVDSTMEYKKDGESEYIAIDGNEIANLPSGTYKVRYKKTENYLAGADKTMEIVTDEMITVTFDSNGGSVVESKTCKYNQTITEPEAEPTKDGYEFVGWFADSKCTTEWNFDTDKFTENKTLYAKWVQGTVSKEEGQIDKVTADGLNDIAKKEKTDISLIVQVQETSKDKAEQTAIKSVKNAPKNFGFYDINLKKSTGGTIAEASSVIEIRLPYNFTKKKNVKVYRYHDGNAQELTALTERVSVKPFTDGTCFVDTKNGYIYIYSSKFSTYAVAYDTVSSSSGGSGGRHTTYYTVSFETNGAGSVDSQTIIENGIVNKPNEPTKDGYVFDGWYLSKSMLLKQK